MPDYYILSNDNDPATTGQVFPQIARHKGWCYDNYIFLSTLRPDVLPKEDFRLEYLELHEKAKLTNFLSDGILSWGFIVSEHVRSILKDCKLPTHRFYPATIEVDNIKLDTYYWFFPTCNMYLLIDFQASKFQISHRFLPNQNVINGVTFKDISEVKRFERNNSSLRVKCQSISFSEEINYDIFQIGGFSFDWIVTDRLKLLFEKYNISGYVIKQIDWIKSSEKK